MNRSDYETALHDLLNDAHTLTAKIHALTDRVDDAGTAEWNMLYDASRLTAVTADLIYRELYPLPSGTVSADEWDVAKPATSARLTDA